MPAVQRISRGRARRVRQVIFGKHTAFQQRIEQRQARCGAVAHRYSDRAVQFHYRRWIHPRKHIVKSDDLLPVGVGDARCFCVHGGDRRLDAVAAQRDGTLSGPCVEPRSVNAWFHGRVPPHYAGIIHLTTAAGAAGAKLQIGDGDEQ